MTRSILLTLALILMTTTARGDGLLFSYDGDVFPDDPTGGFEIFNACELDCSRRLENGHFVLEWGMMGDLVNYDHLIAEPGGATPPPTLWIEWQFRSNQPLPQTSASCDGRFKVDFIGINDSVFQFQDAVADFGGTNFILGLDPDIFHTYRFESPDGNNFTLSVDGVVFKTKLDSGNVQAAFVQFGGLGSCPGFRPQPVRNEWDYIRYGTIESGETFIGTDPPSGVILDEDAVGVTSILVTFDGPNYAYVDDLSVSVTSGIAPNVVATRRLDNGSPDVLEVVLDSELPLNVTTTLTFADGNQTIEYRRLPPFVPTASAWGLVVMTLALLAGGVLMSRRSRVV